MGMELHGNGERWTMGDGSRCSSCCLPQDHRLEEENKEPFCFGVAAGVGPNARAPPACRAAQRRSCRMMVRGEELLCFFRGRGFGAELWGL